MLNSLRKHSFLIESVEERSDCSYITEMEPDQDRGYCEACGGNTVVSALVLAGLI